MVIMDLLQCHTQSYESARGFTRTSYSYPHFLLKRLEPGATGASHWNNCHCLSYHWRWSTASHWSHWRWSTASPWSHWKQQQPMETSNWQAPLQLPVLYHSEVHTGTTPTTGAATGETTGSKKREMTVKSSNISWLASDILPATK